MLALSPESVSPAQSEPAFVDTGVLTCATLQSFPVLRPGHLLTHILQDPTWFLSFVHELMSTCGAIGSFLY